MYNERQGLNTSTSCCVHVVTLIRVPAGCERVFSLLDWMFTSNQESLLGDALEVGLKLRYNKRNVG
eukprot:SAG31_NODE_29999_length_386_cov_1.494774_1_plen_66_part_00